VAVRRNGSVESVVLNTPSRHEVLNQAARRIVQDDLSVRATETLVRKLQAPGRNDRRRRIAQALEDVQRRLTTHLAAPVQVQNRGAKGIITIRYSGDEDLQRILEKLGLKAG
jgi:ParB family chromosome partitioning protein